MEWPRKHSPGFTLGNYPPRLALKGPSGTARIGSEALNLDRVRISSPFSFRAKRLFRLTQGETWAKLSCRFRACPSRRMTDAKHIK
jgi:hypothetical protein